MPIIGNCGRRPERQHDAANVTRVATAAGRNEDGNAPSPTAILRKITGCDITSGPDGVDMPPYRMAVCVFHDGVQNSVGSLVRVWTKDPSQPDQPLNLEPRTGSNAIVLGADFYMTVAPAHGSASPSGKALIAHIAAEVHGTISR